MSPDDAALLPPPRWQLRRQDLGRLLASSAFGVRKATRGMHTEMGPTLSRQSRWSRRGGPARVTVGHGVLGRPGVTELVTEGGSVTSAVTQQIVIKSAI